MTVLSSRTEIYLMLLKFFAGRYLSKLPMEPKLGKMLILGAILGCLDPILTVAAGLSVRDPFLTPQDKKDVSPSPTMYKIKCSSTSYLALYSYTIYWSLVIPVQSPSFVVNFNTSCIWLEKMGNLVHVVFTLS